MKAAALITVVLLPVLAHAASVTVDGSVEYQTVEGFGGHLDGPGDVCSGQFWNNLFNQVGVTVLYDYVAVGHDQWDDTELFPLLREARRYGVRNVNSSFNSTPTAWKDANDYILPQHYADWANEIVNYVNYIKTNTGMDVTEIAAFNEPTIGTQGPYERCRITASEYINFLHIAGPVFRAGIPNVRIHVPVNWGIQMSISYANTILADPSVLTYIDRLSTHCYGWDNGSSTADKWQAFAGIAQSYGKVTAHTETFHGGSNNPPPHPAGLLVAKWVHEAFVDGNAVTFHWWDMFDKGSHRTARGFVFSKDWPPGEFTTDGITKHGFALRQFARWVRPGAIRVETTSDDSNVLASAYKHPVQNTATIVAINDATSSRTVTFTVGNLASISSLNAYRTSISEDGVDLGAVTISAGSFTFDLPPESTTTFFAGSLNMPPHAVATANPTTVQVGETVTLDASGSSDSDGDPLTYTWDFGDGGGATGVAPTHSYASAGTYTVTLTADDGRGETSADSLQIVVTAPDMDGDGYAPPQDCNDNDPAIHPGASEICDDTVDNDCDGDADCSDADCHGVGNCSLVSCQALAVLFHLDNDPAHGETPALAHDFTENGHDGTISNATFNPAGMFGGCYEFDGSTSDIDLGSALSLDDLEPYTLTMWIKPRSATGYLVAKEFSGAAGSWRLGIESSGALMWYKVTSGGAMTVETVAGTVQVGAWQHVALTWDGTVNASGVHVYVDGVEASYQTLNDGAGTVQSDDPYGLHLGSRAEYPEIFDGWMDEVAIWSRVLPAQEVSDLVALGGPLPCAGSTCTPTQEICDNGIDEDCDGQDLVSDADGDGHASVACGGADCDDGNASVNPGAQEICANGVDDDCDGTTDGCPACTTDADCDDNDVCNGPESCQGGSCVAGTPMACDDGNACTTDSCDPAQGCQHAGNTLVCDDGDACTMNDVCSQGACSGVPLDADGDGSVARSCGGGDCDDGDANVHPGVFEGPHDAAVCGDGVDNNCDGLTDQEQASCRTCATDADCDDGSACNGQESCQGGSCAAGTPLDCDDANPCTTDACDPVNGCQNSPNDLPCSDGDDCTMNDRCSQGTCSGDPTDADGDGHVNQVCGGDDCNDSDASAHPDAEEVCGDGVDQDCDGQDEDCGRPNGGCGCSQDGRGADATLLLVLAALLSRRRRQPRR